MQLWQKQFSILLSLIYYLLYFTEAHTFCFIHSLNWLSKLFKYIYYVLNKDGKILTVQNFTKEIMLISHIIFENKIGKLQKKSFYLVNFNHIMIIIIKR